MSGRNLIVSGGPLHDFASTAAALVEIIEPLGFTSTVPDDPTEALERVAGPPGWDLIAVHALLWRMPAERHAALRDAWAFRLGDDHADALVRHVAEGGALLACHTAPICFDGDARWRSLLGASWDWSRSHHPPRGPAAIRPTSAASHHPITEGIGPFETVDEVYADLDLDEDVEPLLVGEVDGRAQPVLWARSVGRGRVVVDLLGHDRAAVEHPVHAELLRRAVGWLVDPVPVGAPAITTSEVAS